MQPDRITRTAEIAYVVLILAVAGIVWREASALPPAPYDALGPKSFPIWVSYALAALGLAMLARLLLGRSLGRAAQAMVVGLEDVMRRARRATLGRGRHAGPRIRLCGDLQLPQRRLPAGDRRLPVPVRTAARPDRPPARPDRRDLRGRGGDPARPRLPHDLQARSGLKPMTLADAFLHLFTLNGFLIMAAGVVLGISVGVLPGITAGMLMALTLPFTYHMSSVHAVSLLIAMFVGGVSGGLITATLMRIPGEPNAIMTCLDGYQLARRGAPGRALGLGNASSLVGGALSWIALVLLAPPLASIAVSFGPFENFAVIVMALILISSLSEGSFLKGLSAGLLGMLVSYPGIDESSGMMRLTFGFTALEGGFNSLPVILGMFAVSQVVTDALDSRAMRAPSRRPCAACSCRCATTSCMAGTWCVRR